MNLVYKILLLFLLIGLAWFDFRTLRVPNRVTHLLLFGGLFLLYLAWRITQMQIDISGKEENRVRFQSMRNAIFIIWLNPQFYVNWTTIVGPSIAAGFEQSLLSGLGYLVGYYGVFVPSLFAWMFFPSMIANLFRENNRVIYYILGLILAGYGIYILVLGLSYFL